MSAAAISTRLAWAIRLGRLDRPQDLAGVYFFARGPQEDFQDGNRTAVFRTREQARARCRKMYHDGLGKRPQVVRVRITIQEVPDGIR
jgi:hypothetical protein